MPQPPNSIAALDVGSKRVGVAVTSLVARLPRPLLTLTRDDRLFEALEKIINEEAIGALVVGLPRGMQGQSTAQTATIEAFKAELRRHFSLPIMFQDEALTSNKAEAELEARGRPYAKSDIDALAATYILEDFLTEHADLSNLTELEA